MSKNKKIYRKVIAYLSGELSAKELEEFEKLLREDPALDAMVEYVRSALEAESADTESSMAASAHRLLDRQLNEAMKRTKSGLHALTTYDSSLTRPSAGYRDISTDSRRLKFRSGESTLSLTAYLVGYMSFELIGMLSEHDKPQSIKVKLYRGRHLLEEAAANKHGVFRFERVESGHCTLKVYVGRKLHMTADLDLQT